ncbi:hypothetical protein H8K35_08220 [Undibacterium sp. LX40W]|uniref:Uncharacterized protein n=1 Tax=Undibacterium nitidum TaxID=2762298 RepID=A0A923KSU5_9BURK|nr:MULTISPECIES: hypothetical protein [Undibacterium]MBC3881581.1 hypothetical protein [Undibacterium nitidum]MBC3891637.1 hypothetical protein [Undibacterium sp. LX40W]
MRSKAEQVETRIFPSMLLVPAKDIEPTFFAKDAGAHEVPFVNDTYAL